MPHIFSYIKNILINFLPLLTTLFIGVLCLILLSKIIYFYQKRSIVHSKVAGQLLQFFAFIVLVISLIIASPLAANNKEQLLSLVGILLAGAIALSSTTFLGNLMAGLMIRSLKKFGHGDFLSVNEVYGRVSEIGLLHTEIQTIDRDLTTLPNLYLVTNPLKVIAKTGTIISEEVSLGYDVHRKTIKEALLKAAEKTDLQEPFVHIQALGDYSVIYKVHGLLEDVKSIITSKAKLRKNMLDFLHLANIEIASPTFMNQRVIKDKAFIPEDHFGKESEEKVEDILFHKAEEAESNEKLQEMLESINLKLKSSEKDENIKEYNQKLINQKEYIIRLLKERKSS